MLEYINLHLHWDRGDVILMFEQLIMNIYTYISCNFYVHVHVRHTDTFICTFVTYLYTYHIFLVQEKPEVIGDVTNERDILATRLISKFHFVDLAGSERVNRTHNRGERFQGTCLNV